MNRYLFIVVGCAILMAVGYYYFKIAVPQGQRLERVKQKIIASQHPRVLHFYSDGCGACQAFAPILKEALRPYGNTIECKDYDIYQNCNGGFMLGAFGNSAIPCTVIFDRYGNQVTKLVGCVDGQTLEKYLQQAVRAQPK